MSRKRIIIIGILLIGTGILLWNFGLLSSYNYLTAKSDIAKKNIQIVYVGEPMLAPSNINAVSEKYGFKVVGFGCTLSKQEQNGIEIYNSQMDNYLDKLNQKGWKSEYKKEIDSLMKLTNIPKTAFWIEKNGSGNWFNVDWMHNHKNYATISIFDNLGNLITKGDFFIVCPSDEIEFMDNLETQIDFYDGQNIQLKSNCYLMKRK